MTSKQQKRPKAEQSVLMRVLSNPKTTLVLGIFAFLSIIYYKVRIAPPDDEPKKGTKKTSVSAEDRPLLTLGVLGKTREDGPVLTRSFFATGDIVISGTASAPQWGLISMSGSTKESAVEVVHPWQATQPILPWIRERGGRFALFRILATPSIQQHLVIGLLAMRRNQSLPTSARTALQARRKQQIQHWLQSAAHSRQSPAATSKPGSTPSPGVGMDASVLLLDSISDTHWVDILYRRAGIQSLPVVSWIHPRASTQWLQQLVQKSHYNDLAP